MEGEDDGVLAGAEEPEEVPVDDSEELDELGDVVVLEADELVRLSVR